VGPPPHRRGEENARVPAPAMAGGQETGGSAQNNQQVEGVRVGCEDGPGFLLGLRLLPLTAARARE